MMKPNVFRPSSINKDLCPIIFLHAIFDSARTWNIVAPQIGAHTRRNVHCVDARNHGESTWSDDFTLQLMVQDIKKLLRKENIAKAIFVGSSMGGNVAMRLALQAPELVEKLIVEDMVPDPYLPNGWQILLVPAITLRKAVEKVPENSNLIEAKKGIAEYLSTRIPHMFPNQNHEFGLEVMPLIEENGKFKWQANLDAIEAALVKDDFDDGDMDGIYEGETLFLYGPESDMKVGVDSEIPHLFPQLIKIPVPGAGNMTHFEKPEEFVKHVVAFINGEMNPTTES